VGQGLAGWVLKNEAPLLVDHLERTASHLGYGSAPHGLKAFYGCPVPGGRGALCVTSKKAYAFSVKEQKILELFARTLAAMDQETAASRTVDEEARLAVCLQRLLALREQHPRWSEFLGCFLRDLTQGLETTHAFLVVSDEWGKGYLLEASTAPLFRNPVWEGKVFEAGSGILGWVFKKNQPVIYGQECGEMAGMPLFGRQTPAVELRTLMAFPLKVHRRCRGVLAAGHVESRPVRPAQHGFMRAAADYLALLLENLYLRNRMGSRQASAPSTPA
jgi:transcriptional regulator with GAF, ATPase, and Fis domain